MKGSASAAVVVAIVLATGTVALWLAMSRSNVSQVARIAEAESYAARSQLVRNIDAVFNALRSVRTFWDAYGHLPREQWSSDAGIEFEHFEGIDMIVWDDPERDIRYVRTPEKPAFDYRPDDDEWAAYQELVGIARVSGSSGIIGPLMRDESYEFIVVAAEDGEASRLAARIDMTAMLSHFFEDESPGFAVQVHAADELIFERGTPAPDAPEAWVRSGLIRSTFGSLWRVTHLPTRTMVDSYSTNAIDLSLLLGLFVAVLMGTLTFENGRARSRAYAAERAERQIGEINRDLETIVANRTRELAARTTDLQTLTDSVAHDLRNPLNVLAVNIELLEDELASAGDAGERQKILDRMTPCISQMSEVLDRLLDLSTLANTTFERTTVDMQALTNDIYEDLIATETGSEVDFHVDDLPPANADETLTHIVLLNLLSNALKYSQGCDERRIRVGCERTDAETIYFVRDNGIGFDENQAEKIFNAFTRLDEDGDQDGIGLGLMLVRKVISRHAGRIWASGEPGKGATFYFTLEAAPAG